jgi:hypothetical protein
VAICPSKMLSLTATVVFTKTSTLKIFMRHTIPWHDEIGLSIIYENNGVTRIKAYVRLSSGRLIHTNCELNIYVSHHGPSHNMFTIIVRRCSFKKGRLVSCSAWVQPTLTEPIYLITKPWSETIPKVVRIRKYVSRYHVGLLRARPWHLCCKFLPQ